MDRISLMIVEYACNQTCSRQAHGTVLIFLHRIYPILSKNTHFDSRPFFRTVRIIGLPVNTYLQYHEGKCVLSHLYRRFSLLMANVNAISGVGVGGRINPAAAGKKANQPESELLAPSQCIKLNAVLHSFDM